MVQETALRAALLGESADPIIVCGQDHYPYLFGIE